MSNSQLEPNRPAEARVASETAPPAAFPMTRAQLFGVLAIYFGLHALLRGLVSETAGIDDVDQVLRAQLWSWGYGPQPPLYTWLTKIVLGVFGYNTYALALLKELLMFAIYALTYANTRWLTRSHVCGVVAAAMLQFCPSISWESHRELTHVVLASALVLASLYTLLRLDPNRWTGYLLFGVCSGLGVLSKYNFLVPYVAMLLAALCVREIRPGILNRKMLAALAIAAALCAPHVLWVGQNPELAFATIYKLKIQEGSRWAAVLTGFKKWISVAAAHTGLMLALTALIFHKRIKRFALAAPGERVVGQMLLWVVAMVTAGILLFKVTGFRDRYLQPLFVSLPILLTVGLRGELSIGRQKLILAVSVVSALVILPLAAGRVLLTESLRKNEVLNTPWRALAKGLKPAAADAECIIGENYNIAGNLRLQFPDKLVVDPLAAPLFQRPAGKVLVVWNADKSPGPPEEFMRFVRAFTGRDNLTRGDTIEEVLKYHHQRTIRLGTGFVE